MKLIKFAPEFVRIIFQGFDKFWSYTFCVVFFYDTFEIISSSLTTVVIECIICGVGI